MALVTIQRSPSPSNDPDADVPDGTEEGASGRSPLRSRRTSKSRLQKLRKFFHTVRFITKLRPCLSESYFTVKGTALILPQSECARKTSKKSHGGDIQQHLQSMLYLLRHEDRIKVAVKLEQTGQGHQRYLALVWTVGRQDTEESVILGIDYTDQARVGLVLPIWAGTKIKLNGDGGFSVSVDDVIYLFKPVSVQAMWSALQCLQKVVSMAEEQKYIPGGLTHTWVEYYNAKMDSSDCTRYSQWRAMEGIEIFGPNAISDTVDDNQQAMQSKISAKLKQVMMSVDLDEATSKSLRTAVEEQLDISLSDFKSYFDSEMIRILGQMDSPSMILDFLFLGSEWNASNLEELRNNGIGYILNVTREIDNFYTGILSYMNVRVYDEPESELLKHWEKTYKYINKAKKHGSKVLVHCKMGISRSASTVIAYLMKENRWSLEKALAFVQEKRNVINPNSGFREQLTTYEGMLKASDHRHVFHSSTEPNLGNVEEEEVPPADDDIFLGGGLFHSDWSQDELASEEILRSLKLEKGQGDNDDMMMEADLETGSRSTDSLEESLPDIPSPTPDQDLKKKNTGQYDFHSDPTSYIVSGAVAGNEPPVLEESSDSSSDEELMDCGENGPEAATVGCQIPTIVEPARELTFVDMSAGQSRIKPDNSWIKLDIDSSESTDDPTPVNEQESTSTPVFRISDEGDSPEVDMPHPETYLCPVELFKPTTSPVHMESEGEEESSSDVTLEASHMDTSNDLTAQTVGEVTGTQEDVEQWCLGEKPDSSSLSEEQVELGVKQYYAQEQIPWFPGTVQKIKQEISKSAIESLPCECSSAKTDNASDVKLESDIEILFHDCGTSKTTYKLTCPPLDLHTSQSCGEFETLDLTERPAKRRRPVSVYEKEEIHLQQGLVRKTTLEIEEKHRLFSGEADQILFGISKPVQRSSSLKEERSSSKSRRSERRKTCGPILSPPILKPQDKSVELDEMDKAHLCDTAVVVEDRTLSKHEIDGSDREQDLQSNNAIEFVKYGDEEVPLVKGKVKKQTQDFESKMESDMEKGGVCISMLTSDEGREVSSPVHSDSSATAGAGDVSASHNIPKAVSCDKQQSLGAPKITDRWRGVMEEKCKSDHSNMTSCVSKPAKSTEEKSPFNDETLALIREIGSVLVNTPVKPPSVEPEMEGQECSNVKMVVRQIEMQQKNFIKKPQQREIIIIEDTSKKNSSSSTRSLDRDRTESCSSNKPPSIVQTAGSVFGLQGFHNPETSHQSKHRTVELQPGKGDLKEDHGLSASRSLDSCSADRNNLSLNLFGEAGMRAEVESRGFQEEVMVEGDAPQVSNVRSPTVSPRSDADHSVVKHLVGRFEKDVISPILEKVEFISGGKRSHSVSESPTSKEAGSDVTGSISPESLSFQMRKDFLKGGTSQSGVKSSEKTSPRLTRPKSADHAETRSCKSVVEQFRLKRQGNTSERHPKTTEVQFEQQAEPNPDDCRKVRCLQGKSHPLTKLNTRLGSKPFYNTM